MADRSEKISAEQHPDEGIQKLRGLYASRIDLENFQVDVFRQIQDDLDEINNLVEKNGGEPFFVPVKDLIGEVGSVMGEVGHEDGINYLRKHKEFIIDKIFASLTSVVSEENPGMELDDARVSVDSLTLNSRNDREQVLVLSDSNIYHAPYYMFILDDFDAGLTNEVRFSFRRQLNPDNQIYKDIFDHQFESSDRLAVTFILARAVRNVILKQNPVEQSAQ